MFSCEYCEIFKNTFFYKTPPVAASENFFHFQSGHAYGYYTYKRKKYRAKSSVKMLLREIFRNELCRLVFSHLFQVRVTRSSIMLKMVKHHLKILRSSHGMIFKVCLIIPQYYA